MQTLNSQTRQQKQRDERTFKGLFDRGEVYDGQEHEEDKAEGAKEGTASPSRLALYSRYTSSDGVKQASSNIIASEEERRIEKHYSITHRQGSF